MAWKIKTILVLSAILGSQCIDDSSCTDKIDEMYKNQRLEFGKLSLASGKSLPSDAGKYVMCMDMDRSRYFLVKMNATLPTKTAMSIPVEIGLCVPDVCDHVGMLGLMKSKTIFKYLPDLKLMKVEKVTTTSPQLDLQPYSTGSIIATAFVGLLVLLVLVSSAAAASSQRTLDPDLPRFGTLDMQQRQGSADGCYPFHVQNAATRRLNLVAQAFSMVGNSGTLKKLLEIPAYKPTDCLNGLRVLSMAWIILGHTFIMPEGVSGYTNQEDIVMTPLNSNAAERSPFWQLIMGSQFGVDTFFFLSGFLLSFLTLKELREGRIKVWAVIILRYLRLTPSLALAMLVFYKIWAFFGYGPFAVQFQNSIISRCNGSWWSELTYTLNFDPFDSNKVCMGWTWYLGDDMIFFIIAILILPIYHWRPRLGWLSVITLTIISWAVTAWLITKYNLGVYALDKHYQILSYWAYSKPYTRIPAYFVGLVAAWLLDAMERRGITRETRPSTPNANMLATTAAVLASLGLLFLTFISYTDYGDNKNSWGNLTTIIFLDFARPAWSCCWSVIVIVCYYDYLPKVNGFLAHPYWTPLARLTYGAYLAHPMFIKLAAGRSVQFYTWSVWYLMYHWVGNVLMAYSGSVVLWCLVERPCMTLFSPARKPRQTNKIAQNPECTPEAKECNSSSKDKEPRPDSFSLTYATPPTSETLLPRPDENCCIENQAA